MLSSERRARESVSTSAFARAGRKNPAHVSRCETRPVTSSRSVDAESHKGEARRLRSAREGDHREIEREMENEREKKMKQGGPSERITRGKEFRAMLQLMRIKPRRIYHATARTLPVVSSTSRLSRPSPGADLPGAAAVIKRNSTSRACAREAVRSDTELFEKEAKRPSYRYRDINEESRLNTGLR